MVHYARQMLAEPERVLKFIEVNSFSLMSLEGFTN